MSNIQILDCTLRDGGYINNWDFQDSDIIKILKALNRSNIDIIECGYLNNKIGKRNNSTLFDSVITVSKILTSAIPKTVNKVVMINLGDFDIKNLPPKNDTEIDGIRLAFHKKDFELAYNVSKLIIQLGYKLYFQPMVTKNYKDIEFLTIIERVNLLNPHAFYIVDSFGSMSLEEFHKYLILAHNNLKSTISLGYHSHNNMQLAFSNAISMCTQNFKRDMIIDSSIYGIGRGAGNLNSELITDYLNKSYNKRYDTLPLLEIMDELLVSLMSKNPWGFSPAQFLSASYNCHPNYATYLINKNTNHIVSIKKILDNLSVESKSTFDKKTIKKLYKDFIIKPKSEIKGDLNISNESKILLLASGKSVNAYKDCIKEKLSEVNCLAIAINHIPFIVCDYYIFTNQLRYDEFSEIIDTKKLVVTNNIEIKVKPFIVLDFSKLVLEQNDELITNATILVINLLIQKEIRSVEIAGLDGYQIGIDNYSYNESQIALDIASQKEKNSIIKKSLQYFEDKIKIQLITSSIFDRKKENN